MHGIKVVTLSLLFFILIQMGCGPSLVKLASEGDTTKVKTRLDKGANAEDVNTAIVYASRGGNTEIVRLLLEYKACSAGSLYWHHSVKAEALREAALYGHVDIVELLLNYGADIEAQVWVWKIKEGPYREGNNYVYEMEETSNGPNALVIAIKQGHTDVVKTLLRHGSNPNILLVAEPMHTNSFDPGFVAIYNPVSTNICPTKEIECTPLMMAVIVNKPEIVKILLESGADVNLTDRYGLSALDHAEKLGLIETAKILKSAGAK